MRVTNKMMVQNMSWQLNSSLSRMSELSEQLSTGKRFSRPSQDPVGTVFSMRARNDLGINDQFRENVRAAQDWLNLTDNAMNNMGETIHRSRELMTQAASDVHSPGGLEAIAQEVRELQDGIMELANTRLGERYIFGGQRTTEPPLERVVDEEGQVQYLYNGDEGPINMSPAPGTEVDINMNAAQVFQPFIEELEQFIGFLEEGDIQGISELKGSLDEKQSDFMGMWAQVGAAARRMDLSEQRIMDQDVYLQKVLSDAEDAEITEVITQLKMEENVYRSALASGARIIQPTLIDFMR